MSWTKACELTKQPPTPEPLICTTSVDRATWHGMARAAPEVGPHARPTCHRRVAHAITSYTRAPTRWATSCHAKQPSAHATLRHLPSAMTAPHAASQCAKQLQRHAQPVSGCIQAHARAALRAHMLLCMPQGRHAFWAGTSGSAVRTYQSAPRAAAVGTQAPLADWMPASTRDPRACQHAPPAPAWPRISGTAAYAGLA